MPPVELMRETALYTPVAWSPDRRYLLYRKNVPGSGLDILAFPVDEPKKAVPLLTGPRNEGPNAVFSPDGRWIAFVSDRSGSFETYIARFRGDLSPPAIGGQPVQITTNGGAILSRGWRRDGKEILVASGGGVMAIPIDASGESVSAGKPVPLFRPPASASAVIATANADRFLVVENPYADGQTIHVLTNWRARLAQIK